MSKNHSRTKRNKLQARRSNYINCYQYDAILGINTIPISKPKNTFFIKNTPSNSLGNCEVGHHIKISNNRDGEFNSTVIKIYYKNGEVDKIECRYITDNDMEIANKFPCIIN